MKRFEGKLFGAALGFSFGGPIGAIIGAVVGHLFDTSLTKKHPRIARGPEKELAFVTSLILLLTGTGKADGRMSSKEVQTIKNFFMKQLGYGSSELLIIDRIIQEAIHRDFDLYEVCHSILARTSYEERLFLVHLNYQVAVSDEYLSPREEEFIQKAANYLGIEQYDYLTIKNSFSSYKRRESSGYAFSSQKVSKEDPYTLLGLSNACSVEEVQRAYRNLANKYHPDKVNHLGKEFIDLATKKFTRIQEAYAAIKKERGFA